TITVTDADEIAPGAPSIDQVADDQAPGVGNLANNGKTNDTEPTIRISLVGTGAQENDSVQLYNGLATLGAAVLLDAAMIANGFVDITPDPLTNGNSYDLSATVIYASNNESAHSAHFGFTVDTDIGAAPTEIQLT